MIPKNKSLTTREIFSVFYHSFFGYPLNRMELIKWEAGRGCKEFKIPKVVVECIQGEYVLSEHKGQVYQKTKRARSSVRKLKIAKKAVRILRLIPTIKMVGITGALAMKNANEESDIDLMIICQKGSLWTTRFLTLILLVLCRISFRRYGDRNEKDKLCLNLWLEERSLTWPKNQRNIFTAHEIAQMIPLINKDSTYERFISQNYWVKEYWPRAVGDWAKKVKIKTKTKNNNFFFGEEILWRIQYQIMKSKITKEKVSKTRAIFHPTDWAEKVTEYLNGN